MKHKAIYNILSVLLAVLLYFSFYKTKHSPSIPAISEIAQSLASILSSKEFYGNLLSTMKIVIIGASISFVAGTSIAFVCSAVKPLGSLLMPIVNSTKNVPSIAMFPLFIVLMGIGDSPRIFVIIWNSMYPIISSTIAGFNAVDKSVIEAAQNSGASTFALYSYIKLPLSCIHMLEGLKISISNGFVAIVVAEMLGATKGIGYMILWSANAFKYPEMYSYILVIALVGFLINVIMEKIIKTAERNIYYGKTR